MSEPSSDISMQQQQGSKAEPSPPAAPKRPPRRSIDPSQSVQESSGGGKETSTVTSTSQPVMDSEFEIVDDDSAPAEKELDASAVAAVSHDTLDASKQSLPSTPADEQPQVAVPHDAPEQAQSNQPPPSSPAMDNSAPDEQGTNQPQATESHSEQPKQSPPPSPAKDEATSPAPPPREPSPPEAAPASEPMEDLSGLSFADQQLALLKRHAAERKAAEKQAAEERAKQAHISPQQQQQQQSTQGAAGSQRQSASSESSLVFSPGKSMPAADHVGEDSTVDGADHEPRGLVFTSGKSPAATPVSPQTEAEDTGADTNTRAARSSTLPPRASAPAILSPAGDPRNQNQAEESYLVSRRGTVVGKRGSISSLRDRFASIIETQESSSSSAASSAQSTPRRVQRSQTMIETPSSYESRRGSVVLKKGVVSRFRNAFARKSMESDKPKTLAEICYESERTAGERIGGKLVMYFTSSPTVRETFYACQNIVRILQGHRFKYEERDVSLSRRFAKELKSRKPDCSLPLLFLNGEYLGGAKEIEELNENDELTTVLEKVPKHKPKGGSCDTCGNKGFIPCTWCGGDRKSVMSRFGKEIVALKCTVCNENGLQRCMDCSDPMEEESEA